MQGRILLRPLLLSYISARLVVSSSLRVLSTVRKVSLTRQITDILHTIMAQVEQVEQVEQTEQTEQTSHSVHSTQGGGPKQKMTPIHRSRACELLLRTSFGKRQG